ncbi:unnamed protein product [Bursaphelenchus xylophilus]|uniref:(pine wood nematode) hypothetical protein n=1 Tax=Bursaphelenchus xylophilus TaxID=6326 RepID=A0A1I7RXR9_BURXY|nr:unnamed protein product [Bursaphelenchus xylophilus]CAG9126685.1 unnamed protein product [Bursaphelenchus xylophilus]
MPLFIRNLSKDEKKVLRHMHDQNSTKTRVQILESYPEMFKKFAKVATKTLTETRKDVDAVSKAFINEVTEYFIEADLVKPEELETPGGKILDGRLERLIKKWNVLSVAEKTAVDSVLDIGSYFEGVFEL